MKKKHEKKGFTLIELLVSIAILSIITLLALPAITRLGDSTSTKKFTAYEEAMKSAAKLYVDSYSEDMWGRNEDGCLKISVTKLRLSNLIKPFNVENIECENDDTYINVTKNNSKYSYDPSLVCKKDGKVVYSNKKNDNNCIKAPDKEGPKITITPNGKSPWFNYKALDKVTVIIEDESILAANAEFKYKWTTNKNDTSNSGYQEVKLSNNATSKTETTIKIPRDITGEYYLKIIPIYVRDIIGNVQSNPQTSDVFKIDNTPPTLPTINLYKWKNNANTSRPTSTSGLSSYTENTWSSLKVYTTASGSIDVGSNVVNYEFTTTGTTANESNTVASSRSIEADGVSTIKYRACDSAGNCSAYSTAKTIKIDKIAPKVPTVRLYKWKDNSTRPSSESGLATYTNNTWDRYKVYTKASGSTDTGGSGISKYQYTTTGKTANVSDYDGSARNIEANGESTIKYRACDNAGNCSAYSNNYTIKIDTIAPSIPTISMYKWKDNDTKPTSSKGLSAYSNNTWSNKKIRTEASSTDTNGSGISKYQYTTTGKTANVSDYDGSARNIEANGTSTIKYRACDNVGNCSAYSNNYTIKIDTIDPDKPTISMYKWKDNNTKPTSSKGLSAYSNNTWSNKKIRTEASSTDTNGSGVEKYQYTTTGATENVSNYDGSARNIEANGESTIKYRACDNAGNCSSWSDKKTVKVDKANPTYGKITKHKGNPFPTGNFKYYILIPIADSHSGIGRRKAWSEDSGNPYHEISDENLNGLKSGKDTIANSDTYIKYWHEMCDLAGNCVSKSGTVYH